MRRLFLAILIGILSWQARAAVSEPDFAFPKTVVANAEQRIAKAEGQERLMYLMEIVKAKSEIDPDSLYAMPALVAKYAEGATGVERGLMHLYQAELLKMIYCAKSWKYDSVDAPISPLPDSPELWSGEQFKQQIARLAMLGKDEILAEKSKALSTFSVVTQNVDTPTFFPTIADFACKKAYQLLGEAGLDDEATQIAMATAELQPEGSAARAWWLCTYASNQQIMQAYTQRPTGIGGAYLLEHICDNGDIEPAEKIAMLNDYLNSQPTNILTNDLAGQLAKLTAAETAIWCNSIAAPGREFEVAIRHSYTEKYGVAVLKASTTGTKRKFSEVKRYVFDSDKTTVDTDTIKITFDSYGEYQLKPIANGEVSNYASGSRVYVAPVFPYIANCGYDNALFLVNYGDGAPVAKAKVEIASREGYSLKELATTGADGIARFEYKPSDKDKYSSRISISHEGIVYNYANELSLNRYYEPSKSTRRSVTFFTDRPIYHPGDSINWSLVAVDIAADNSKVAGKAGVAVILADANYQRIDTVEIVTDESGRACGGMKIPTDRMAGRFTIQAVSEGNYCSSHHFMVADFKAPTFEVSDLTSVNMLDSVEVSGRAVSYSGMPIENAKVDVDAEMCRWWWRAGAAQGSAGPFSGVTDSNGEFRIAIPKDKLASTGAYIFNVDVTSTTAETATGSCRLNLGKPLSLVANLDSYKLCTDDIIKLPITCVDSNGNAAGIAAKWALYGKGGAVATGVCETDSIGIDVDWRKIKAGIYSLVITPSDEAQCDSLKVENLALYSIKNNDVCSESRMIVLADDGKFEASGEIGLNIGVAKAGHVFVVVAEDGVMQSSDTYKVDAGFNRINIATKKATQKVEIRIATWTEDRFADECVTFTKPETDDVEIAVESWRDSLEPNAEETWKITLRRGDGKPVPGALVATMYNYALETLAPNQMTTLSKHRFLGYSPKAARSIDCNYIRYYLNKNLMRISPKAVQSFSLLYPNFKYLPEELMQVRDMSTRMMLSANKSAARPMKAEATEEYAMDEIAVGAVNDTGADSGEGTDTEEYDYRDIEELQAFWMPMLSFDESGSATITFTTPQSNGAWAVRAWAWSNDLHAAMLTKRCTTAKPLMVQSNLPRFMREGDDATILATIFNNSDSEAIVGTMIEIFNATDGSIISTEQLCDSIPANGSAIVGAKICANAGQSAIGYRIKSSAGNYTDGEQGIIPVLASEATTYEGRTFYLTPTDDSFSTTIADDKNAINAIEICANPIWEVVKALPSLYDKEPSTATRAAASLYAACTAQNINAKFPVIANTAKSLLANDADSILISNLQRNDDLKMAMLQQTPWMIAAENGTARMQRIAITLDDASNKAIAKKAVDVLKQLQRADGGFAWGTWATESSLWITRSVLASIGALNSFGSIPDNAELSKMIDKAFGYLDKSIKANDTDMAYAALYAAYPDRKPSTLAGQQAISRTVQEIIKNWKGYSVELKARAALILQANGNKATARQIIASIRQFEVNSKQAGISFPSVGSVDSYSKVLEAFAKIDPQEQELDGMCQWLLVRTQSTDQLGARAPMPLISAILSTSPQKPEATPAAQITINGKPLEELNSNTLGYANLRLTADYAGKKVTIKRADATTGVAYGSIISIASQQMSHVEAYGTDMLQIAKRLLVQRDGEWVETATPRLGEQVRVQLTVTAGADMQYVTITDERPAAFEPKDQLPGYVTSGAARLYRINYDSHTDLFINYLRKGVYYITYDVVAATAGTFSSGLATIQSQYDAGISAHSAGFIVNVTKQ